MKVRIFFLVMALLLSTAAFAQRPSYNYLQGSYDVATDPDVHRWALKGSYKFANSFYAFLEDTRGARHAGAGFFSPLQVNLHLYGQLGLADNNDGFRPVLEGGARWFVDQQLELRGAIRFISDGYDWWWTRKDEVVLLGEAVYQLDRGVGLVLGLGIPTEADGVILQLGGRLNY